MGSIDGNKLLWQATEVVPLPKISSPKGFLNDFRPFSILSTLAKVLERVVYVQLRFNYALQHSIHSGEVKKARYVGAQASQFNTYVTLKLQNVKSTTVTVKGATPCWEQDFLFETNDLNTGLLIEVWSKGMIWDRAMGYHWIPLQGVQYSNEEGSGQWLSLEAELVMRDGEVVGTKNPTGHSLLVDCRFELPFDPENIGASELQRKLEMLNHIMDQEARAEQARRQMQYLGHSNYNQFDNDISAGYSEDSDYTSDLNYPVGQHANSSASQYRHAAHQINTPQRSLETSRENSYEKDEGVGQHLQQPMTHQHHLSPGSHRQRHLQQRNSPNTDYGYGSPNVGQNMSQYNNDVDLELWYNSRPRNKPEYPGQVWDNYENYNNYNQKNLGSIDGEYSFDYNYYEETSLQKSKGIRRPSLERQITLYDDPNYFNETYAPYTSNNIPQVTCVTTSGQSFNQNRSYDEYCEISSYNCEDERYGQDEEDRQWDSGGGYYSNRLNGKKLPAIPIVQKRRPSFNSTQDDTTSTTYYNSYTPTPTARRKMPQIPTKRSASRQSSTYYNSYTPTPTARRKMPQIPTKRSASRQSSINDDTGYRTPENSSHRGASLPATPTKTSKILARLNTHSKPFNSLPPTPGRQLPNPNHLLQHRSAKYRRNHLIKRTSSADYSDQDNYDNQYIRSGTMSARDMYDDYYNPGYQSSSSLTVQEELDNAMTVSLCDNSNNANFNTNSYHEQIPQIQQTQYSTSKDSYYSDDYDESDNRRKKMLGQCVTSPYYQQNTDSLESHDDDLKDSFETALSSRESSTLLPPPMQQNQLNQQIQQNQQMQQIQQYRPNIITTINHQNNEHHPHSVTVSVTQGQYNQRDQLIVDSPKEAILPSTTKLTPPMVTLNNNTVPANNNRKVFLKQQDTIDSMYYTAEEEDVLNGEYLNESLDMEYPDKIIEEEPYLDPQESLESFTEEGTVTNGGSVDYNNKAITRESPVSVIHVETYEDDEERAMRRGSSQITVVDPYNVIHVETYEDDEERAMRRGSSQITVVDPYNVPSSRRPSLEPYRTVSPHRQERYP
ncbi:C2 domain [Popillia japonica]|uniref:C2 domain n=1 Tax=Popillia japonica TaxID=7064 RepID=A0AAW1MQ12_POPJA